MLNPVYPFRDEDIDAPIDLGVHGPLTDDQERRVRRQVDQALDSFLDQLYDIERDNWFVSHGVLMQRINEQCADIEGDYEAWWNEEENGE